MIEDSNNEKVTITVTITLAISISGLIHHQEWGISLSLCEGCKKWAARLSQCSGMINVIRWNQMEGILTQNFLFGSVQKTSKDAL